MFFQVSVFQSGGFGGGGWVLVPWGTVEELTGQISLYRALSPLDRTDLRVHYPRQDRPHCAYPCPPPLRTRHTSRIGPWCCLPRQVNLNYIEPHLDRTELFAPPPPPQNTSWEHTETSAPPEYVRKTCCNVLKRGFIKYQNGQVNYCTQYGYSLSCSMKTIFPVLVQHQVPFKLCVHWSTTKMLAQLFKILWWL